MALSWIGGALLLLAALYVALTAPDARRRAAALPRLYAHRGLHGDDVSENGLEAFERACRMGVGIELDVRFSADGTPVVFHDDTLERMCGVSARVDEKTLSELKALPLPDGGAIPTLAEALSLVGGRVPLLVEIKNCRRVARLCAAVRAQMRAYPGEYVVESFNPLALKWFRRHEPAVLRGQLVGQSDEYLGVTGMAGAFLLANLLTNFLSRPDFVAYDVSMARMLSVRVQRWIYRTPLAAWTVRTARALRWLMRSGQSAIFEMDMGADPIETLDGVGRG